MSKYKKEYAFISVDIQNEFTSEGGKAYVPRASVQFFKKTLFPFLKKKNIMINEIISDYRQPRPGHKSDICHPGEWGYQSMVPDDLRKSTWIKCMHSPVWIRDNIGKRNAKPGLPFPDPSGFSKWLKNNVGKREDVTPIVFGLTIDCCVLSTLQEISWHGYYPSVLREGVDHYSGEKEDRDKILETPISNWAKVIDWKILQEELG